jgi:hypothetical protein
MLNPHSAQSQLQSASPQTFAESMDHELQNHLCKIGPVLLNAEQAGVLNSDLLSPAQYITAAPQTSEITWLDASINSTLLMRPMGSGSFGSVWKVRSIESELC